MKDLKLQIDNERSKWKDHGCPLDDIVVFYVGDTPVALLSSVMTESDEDITLAVASAYKEEDDE